MNKQVCSKEKFQSEKKKYNKNKIYDENFFAIFLNVGNQGL